MHNSTRKRARERSERQKGRRPANFGKRYPAEVLTRDEVRRLMAACSRRAPTGIRNKAGISTLYRTGVRVSELLALNTTDIDRDAGTVRVLNGKGGKSRTVGIDEGALALIDAWVLVRRARGINKSAPLFCTLPGGRMSTEYVRQMLKRMAHRAGLSRRVVPHQFRHTWCVELAREGVQLAHIQRLLGHSSLATTATYLAGLNPQEAIDAIRARPVWREEIT